MRKRVLDVAVGALLLGFSGCLVGQSDLQVKGGATVIYVCAGGERIAARYYSLSDDSLNFVKLSLPDGQKYTLPQVVSASGARYSDDRQLVWWTKGATAFAEMRDEQGAWQIKYADCRELATGAPAN